MPKLQIPKVHTIESTTCRSLRLLKIEIHKNDTNKTQVEQEKAIASNKFANKKHSSIQGKKKIVFHRPTRLHYLARVSHASTIDNVVDKSIRQYLHSLHDVPTQSCTLYEMLCFHKDLYKVDDALVHEFSFVSI